MMLGQNHSQVVQTIAAAVLFIMAVVFLFFPQPYVESVRRRVPRQGGRVLYTTGYARFVHSRAYVPFTRFVGVLLLFFCWLMIRNLL